MSNDSRVHITVKGQVQGIGFRWFVQKTGKRFNLVGWVKNLPNGDVELEAEGQNEDINNFIESLKKDHPWASVRALETEWLKKTQNDYSSFEIRF
ncbi:MAG: acylphosphatase [Endomicrobiales bacterium]|nr:acylphosphatase [Endomicrobiales bacterium]